MEAIELKVNYITKVCKMDYGFVFSYKKTVIDEDDGEEFVVDKKLEEPRKVLKNLVFECNLLTRTECLRQEDILMCTDTKNRYVVQVLEDNNPFLSQYNINCKLHLISEYDMVDGEFSMPKSFIRVSSSFNK